MNNRSFFSELKRRNIYKVAAAYAVVAWLLIQITTQVFPFFEIPNWAVRLVVVLLILGFPVALILSWAYEITPEGIKRESEVDPNQSIRKRTGRKILAFTVVLAVIASALCVFPLVMKRKKSDALGSEEIPKKSIAVLPFENLSDDKQNSFFADGVQDEVLTNLAKVADLKVISRTSVMQYRTVGTRNLREIGQSLGVAHVLEGSVQKIANKVRVNAQLIDARNDAHIWAQIYDRDLADVFAIQSELAQAIAQQLQARLSPNEQAEIAKPPTNDPVAHDLYLRARQLDDLANNPDAKGSLLQAISLLEEAVRRDPKFLRAYCLMCETHLDLYWAGFDHTEQRREMARVALEKAERLDPNAGEVHWMKGLYAYHGFRDYDKAVAELKMAMQLLPNESRLYVLAGAVDRRTARFPEAETNFRHAVELDPKNLVVVMEAALTLQGMRRYADAALFFEKALAIQADDPYARHLLGVNSFTQTGDATAWRASLDTISQKSTEAARSVAFPLLVCSWMQRDKRESEKAGSLIPAEGIANSFDEASIPSEYCIGRTAWLFGDQDVAETALTKARAIFEHLTDGQPEYAQAWSYLGLTDAMLGRCDEAVQEGKRACEILSIKKDSWVGPALMTYLALIHTWCDDRNSAIELLETSITLPGGVTYGELKQSPDWDTLRDDARFEKLLTSLAPKDPKP